MGNLRDNEEIRCPFAVSFQGSCFANIPDPDKGGTILVYPEQEIDKYQ